MLIGLRVRMCSSAGLRFGKGTINTRRQRGKRRQIEPDAFISVSFEMSGSTSLLHVCDEEPDGGKHLGLKLTVVEESTQQLFDASSLLSLQNSQSCRFQENPGENSLT